MKTRVKTQGGLQGNSKRFKSKQKWDLSTFANVRQARNIQSSLLSAGTTAAMPSSVVCLIEAWTLQGSEGP